MPDKTRQKRIDKVQNARGESHCWGFVGRVWGKMDWVLYSILCNWRWSVIDIHFSSSLQQIQWTRRQAVEGWKSYSASFPALDAVTGPERYLASQFGNIRCRTTSTMTTSFKDRNLIAVIGDEVGFPFSPSLEIFAWISTQDSITGLLLAGIGHVNEQQKKNFLVVDASTCIEFGNYHRAWSVVTLLETQISTIEAAFQEFTERKDVAILLINQHVKSRRFVKFNPTKLCWNLSFLDCWEDPPNCRQIPPGVSSCAWDSIERSSLRYVKE